MSTALCLCVLMVFAVATADHHDAAVINVYTSGKCGAAHSHTKENYTSKLIAFSVGRAAGFTPSGINQLPMDYEFYNPDGYFDITRSIFTAPVSGVYEFYFGASGQPGKRVHLYLYAGSPEKPVASTYNYNTASHGHASGSVMLALKKGDQASVWVNANSPVYAQSPPSTHFSGHLLSESRDHHHGDK